MTGNSVVVVIVFWLVLFVAHAALTAAFVCLFMSMTRRWRSDEDRMRRRAARARRRELSEFIDDLR